MQEHKFRTAIADDIHEIALFLEKHGPNKWNYLPKEGVASELADVAKGKAVAVIAECDHQAIGFAILYPRFNRFPKYADPETPLDNIGYISEVVVHNEHTGKGIGTNLVENAKMILSRDGISKIYIDCHEENAASRGMARKAGFEEAAIYADSERRSVGSRKTWVGLFLANN